MKKEVIPKKTIRIDLINSIEAELLRTRNPMEYSRLSKIIQEAIRKESSEQ